MAVSPKKLMVSFLKKKKKRKKGTATGLGIVERRRADKSVPPPENVTLKVS